MVAMGGIGSAGIGGHHPTAIGYAIAAFLVVGGGLLILRLTVAFWVAVAAALALTISGALAWAGHPGWAMPVPPLLSIVIGLYLILRTVMARPALGKRPPRPRSDEPSPAEEAP